jgi:hypothetical protein
MQAQARTVQHHWVTLKSLFLPLLVHPRAAQLIKCTVYAGLFINGYFYFMDDLLAYRSALPEDASLDDLFTNFSTTIDLIGWLGLIALFELETYALPDEAFTARLLRGLRLGRALCYASILYAAYGYTAEALDAHAATLVEGVTSLCQVAGQGLALQVDQVLFEEITAANCAALSVDSRFYNLDGEIALVGESLLPHLRLMGWLDISNAYVWLLVVALIEAEVWLQEKDRFGSRALLAVRLVKSLGYLVLIGNGVAWAFSGYYMWAWDASLWIFGFWAIEFNLAYWEKLRLEELAQTETAPGGAVSPMSSGPS